MRVYWYWPHPHRVASPLALATIRPDDRLTVQALGSLHGERFALVPEYEVVRDLPDPTQTAPNWLAARCRRPRVAVRRSRARRRLIGRGFDVAHLHMLVYQTDWMEMRSLRRACPILASVHDVRPHQRQLPRAVETALLRELYRSAGHLLVHHDVLADELRADFDVDPALIHVLPIPIDATDMRLPTGSSGRPVILLFGALRWNKGVDVLLDAAAMLGGGLEADIVIAGHGSSLIERSTLARASTLANVRVELGFVSAQRKRELFSGASCVVLPYTEFHSQSGVLFDAYSYRLPLVVTDVGAIGPTVRQDGSGVVVPPGDAEALAAALTDVLTRPIGGLEDSIEAAVRQRSFTVVGPQLRALYEAVAAGI